MQGIYAVVGGLNLSNALRTTFKKKWKLTLEMSQKTLRNEDDDVYKQARVHE